MWYVVVDWINLAEDRDHFPALLKSIMKFRVLLKADSFLPRLVTICFSSKSLLDGVYLDNGVWVRAEEAHLSGHLTVWS
jgi:hypothetical protein